MLKNKSILILEDDDMYRVMYRMVLEKTGAHLTFVAQTHQVFQTLPSHTYNLMILNLDMSYDNNGFALFQQIRNIPEYTIMPIIGVSSHDASIMMPKAQKLGFDGFIARPINQHFFCHQIAQVLSGHAVWNTLDLAM